MTTIIQEALRRLDAMIAEKNTELNSVRWYQWVTYVRIVFARKGLRIRRESIRAEMVNIGRGKGGIDGYGKILFDTFRPHEHFHQKIVSMLIQEN